MKPAVRVGFLLAFVLGLLVPSGSVTSMPNDVRIPIVKPHPPGTPPAAALFRHGDHAQHNCFACHPSTFPQHPEGFTHGDMNEGRRCAACHDGSGARAVRDMGCEECHVPR